MTTVNNAPVRAGAALPTIVCYAPVPTGTPTAADRVPDKATPPHPFAELLRQSRADGAAPATPPSVAAPVAASSENDEDTGSSEASEATGTPGSAAAPARTKAKAATPTPAKAVSRERSDDEPDERIAVDKNDKAAGDGNGNGAGSAAAGTTRSDAWIAQAIAGGDAAAGTRGRAGAEARPDGKRALVDSDDAGADTTTGARAGTAATRATIRLEAEAATRAGRADRGDDERAAAAEAPAFAAVIAEATHGAEGTPPRAGGEARIDALASTFAAGPIGADPVAAAAAPSEVALPTPIDSPDFGAVFGVQVSLLAQDGVQQAELHLNPSETGPVSIHIALDGKEARIDFGADLAATREAIERSLPELAAALRDAGLTLTGGGVSQHAGGRSSQGGNAPASSPSLERAGAARSAAEPARTTRRVAAGGVDLYA